VKTILLATSLFVPHNYNTLDSFDRSLLPEKEYIECIDWYKHLPDAEFLSISYLSDGLIVKGIIGKPKEVKNKLPVIIYNRGGSEDTGKMTVETLKDNFYFWIQQGYVVIASQYRGVDGGQGQDECGGADLDDVLTLFDVIKELPYTDSNNIFMIGHSRGGQMALMALRKHAPVKAAAIVSAVTDYFLFEKMRPDIVPLFNRIIPGMPEHRQQEYTNRSGVCWADEIQTPLIIFHGDADHISDISQSTTLVDELKKAHAEYKFTILPNGDHLLSAYQDEIYKQALAWFKAHM
jgi:dipeptidyl aminopeptidase/acylaminoacyl peptidase